MQRLFCLLLASSLAVTGFARQSAAPALLSSEKLTQIKPAMAAAVAKHQAAGIVTLVMQGGKVLHHEAVGFADIAKGRPMEKDALFWIASMTKSINATAVMTLVDAGKLSLDEPASKWLTELGKATLANGQAPARPIVLRDLLSHTAGISFPKRAPSDGAAVLKNYVASLVKTPLAFEPGSAYEYGFGPTVAGRIIEIASGMKYDEYIARTITGPLGMKDTMFNPPDAWRARIARTYKAKDDGTPGLEPGYNPFVTADETVKHMVEPSGGLFSTAADMGRFYSMIASGGELDGVRIVSEKSIAEMTHAHQAGGKDLNYGLGWQVNLPGHPVCASMPVGSFGHGGAFATNGWIDPVHGIVTVYLVQNVNVPASGAPKDVFQKIVEEAAGGSTAAK